jgi:carboxylesterase type B
MNVTELIAQTTAGKVRGTEAADGVLIWRGIPYAAAPGSPAAPDRHHDR